ncbi:MAG: exo-alpha-sialidase [bacterium]|nr:exo-alpha-sialidase [bacterium]
MRFFLTVLLASSALPLSALTAAQPRVIVHPGVALSAAADEWHVEPWLAVDPNDSRRLFAAAMTLGSTESSRRDVVIAHSDDHGATWTEPRVVNDDDTSAHHSNSGLAVNSSGAVGVMWNDRRARPDSFCFETRFAVSVDGGNTFLPSVKLNRTPACPPPGADDPSRPFRFLNGGETQGLVGLEGDAFVAAWIGDGTEPRRPWALRASRIVVER